MTTRLEQRNGNSIRSRAIRPPVREEGQTLGPRRHIVLDHVEDMVQVAWRMRLFSLVASFSLVIRLNSLLRKVGANSRQSSRRLVERVTVRKSGAEALRCSQSLQLVLAAAALSIMKHRLPLALAAPPARPPRRLPGSSRSCRGCVLGGCAASDRGAPALCASCSSRSRNLSTRADLPLVVRSARPCSRCLDRKGRSSSSVRG